MAYNFPTSPALNETFLDYLWDGEKWILAVGGLPAAALLPEAWTLVDSRVISTPVANVDFTGLAGWSDVRVMLRNVNASTTGVRSMRVSTDNGASFLSGSSDYLWLDPAGVESTSDGCLNFSTTLSAAVCTAETIISGWNLAAIKTVEQRQRLDYPAMLIPVASPLNAMRFFNAIGGGTSGNIHSGSIYVYAR